MQTTHDDFRTHAYMQKARLYYDRVRRAEIQYGNVLAGVARHIGELAKGFVEESRVDVGALRVALRNYSDLLAPWARKVASRFVAEVATRDDEVWRKIGKELGLEARMALRAQATPLGLTTNDLIIAQAGLITSLPLDAAKKVEEKAIELVQRGGRPEELAAYVHTLGDVTASRARCIARTEICRSSTMIAFARAKEIGATEYIWRTVHDYNVRHDHRLLDGQTFKIDGPGGLADRRANRYAHPGCIYNCRCHPEIVIPTQFWTAPSTRRAFAL